LMTSARGLSVEGVERRGGSNIVYRPTLTINRERCKHLCAPGTVRRALRLGGEGRSFGGG